MRRNRETIPVKRIDRYVWQISEEYEPGMRVPGRIYADEALMKQISSDRTLRQCCNVAHLPGIYKYAITMPDGHEGYGFPIGGVAATDRDTGVISPGGVGYDINCGVRLLTTNMNETEIKTKLKPLTDTLFKNVPSGLGSSRNTFRLTIEQLEDLLREGVNWAVAKGMGRRDDLKHCEEEGCMDAANPDTVSTRAKRRGLKQVGTLGSGNHFLEIQKVDRILNPKVAKTFGITHEGQVTVMVHCGSRGFGHQVCSDYLQVMERAARRYGIVLPDRELACAPGSSEEAQDYYQAMACAVNYAFANRQAITHWVRESFEQIFHTSAETIGLDLVYDVAHNIVKLEDHDVDGTQRQVWVHRKGATRSFGPNHDAVPTEYQAVGQPVFIPGTMGSSSWVMVGTRSAMDLAFGSTAHGAGRVMSRAAAKRKYRSGDIKATLERRGIIVRSASQAVLAEEAVGAYKDVDRVAAVSHELGLASKVARLVPMAVVKG